MNEDRNKKKGDRYAKCKVVNRLRVKLKKMYKDKKREKIQKYKTINECR